MNKAIVNGVLRREPSVDFQTAQAAELRSLKDFEVLHLAANSKRVLVSHDVNTMPRHFRSHQQAGSYSSGVILVPQLLEVGSVIEDIVLIWQASEATDWKNRLVWLPL